MSPACLLTGDVTTFQTDCREEKTNKHCIQVTADQREIASLPQLYYFWGSFCLCDLSPWTRFVSVTLVTATGFIWIESVSFDFLACFEAPETAEPQLSLTTAPEPKYLLA